MLETKTFALPSLAQEISARGPLELLAAVLAPDGLTAAARLLDCFGSVWALRDVSATELATIAEVTLAQAARLEAALALPAHMGRPPPGEPVRTGADLWPLFAPRLLHERREVFWALGLDAKNRPQREVFVAAGSLCTVSIELRDTFRALVKESAASVLFVHNHPSGDPTPSREDVRLSSRLVQAGRTLGIRVLDHLVIASQGYASALHGGPIHAPP